MAQYNIYKLLKKGKPLYIGIIVGGTLAFIYEYIGARYAAYTFIASVLFMVVIKAIYEINYLKLMWDLGETVMYGKPARRSEGWTDEEFKKAHKDFWKKLLSAVTIGLYWKLIGKHIHKWMERK